MARKKKPTRVEIPLSISINDVSMVGFVSSNIKSYQLAYSLNSTFGIQLAKEIDFELYNEAEDKLYPFSSYYYHNENYNTLYFLIETRNSDGILLHPSLSAYDGILMIAHGNYHAIENTITNYQHSIPGVFICEKIIPNKTFRKFIEDSFLLDIDIYIRNIMEINKAREKEKKEPMFFQL